MADDTTSRRRDRIATEFGTNGLMSNVPSVADVAVVGDHLGEIPGGMEAKFEVLDAAARTIGGTVLRHPR